MVGYTMLHSDGNSGFSFTQWQRRRTYQQRTEDLRIVRTASNHEWLYHERSIILIDDNVRIVTILRQNTTKYEAYETTKYDVYEQWSTKRTINQLDDSITLFRTIFPWVLVNLLHRWSRCFCDNHNHHQHFDDDDVPSSSSSSALVAWISSCREFVALCLEFLREPNQWLINPWNWYEILIA